MNDLNEALSRLLNAYRRYYTVAESAPAPFAAYAEFHMAEEQIFLTNKIKLNESESSEYVYFATEDRLDVERLNALAEEAWRLGSARFTPTWGQKGQDVALVILTRALDSEAESQIPLTRRTISAAFSLKGWSNFALIAMELPSGKTVCNRHGKRLEKVLANSIGKINK